MQSHNPATLFGAQGKRVPTRASGDMRYGNPVGTHLDSILCPHFAAQVPVYRSDRRTDDTIFSREEAQKAQDLRGLAPFVPFCGNPGSMKLS